MHRSDKTDTIDQALFEVQQELGAVYAGATNPFLKNKYADLNMVWDAVKPVLGKHKLVILTPPGCTEMLDLGSAGHGPVASMAIEMRCIHWPSGQYYDLTMTLPLKQVDAQGAGAAITYARRYALSAFLGIVVDKDDDGNAASGLTGKPQQRNKDARLV